MSLFRRVPVVELLLNLTEEVLAEKLAHAEASVVAGMEAKRMTPEFRSLKACVRDALFRLFRKVIPSGDIADAIRDYLGDEVVAGVSERFAGQTPELAALVTATREEAVKAVREIAT